MPQFDAELWRRRALTRFQKASDAGNPSAGSALHRDSVAIDGIDRIVQWCETRQIDVVFVHRSNGLYESPTAETRAKITLSSHLPPEHQMFVLLHECGHHLIGDRKPGQRYSEGWHVDDGPSKRTLLHRIDVIDEELEAWHRGLKLAGRLKIKVNSERYNQTRAKYVKTYLRWATGPSRRRRNGEKVEAA